jgi:hypothetical protein
MQQVPSGLLDRFCGFCDHPPSEGHSLLKKSEQVGQGLAFDSSGRNSNMTHARNSWCHWAVMQAESIFSNFCKH